MKIKKIISEFIEERKFIKSLKKNFEEEETKKDLLLAKEIFNKYFPENPVKSYSSKTNSINEEKNINECTKNNLDDLIENEQEDDLSKIFCKHQLLAIPIETCECNENKDSFLVCINDEYKNKNNGKNFVCPFSTDDIIFAPHKSNAFEYLMILQGCSKFYPVDNIKKTIRIGTIFSKEKYVILESEKEYNIIKMD